ncbi:integrase catalytic domain-containing protein [Trichonephila clavipes]|uniref:Integrase catalytic domain-containing protein n=1 Tax=Trichonephila clavipes TaxID=2585209 RepID=A0A8X6RP87_TRICX|nr:integrase catalytic domain-containing protein [Trichonephila clavipes]
MFWLIKLALLKFACRLLWLCCKLKLNSLGITDLVETKTKLEIQKETLNHFRKTIRVDFSGRYEVALPWVLGNKLLSSNKKLVENRLQSTNRKLIATEVILNQVKKWLEQLPILAGIKIPRCLNLSSNGTKRITLHMFCDASKKVYAACAFLRVEYEENVFVKLMQAKARVAPLRDISILRLELLACSIGARLAASIKNDLSLPDVRIYYLTDSMTALAWIQRSRDRGVYVFNRVKISSRCHVPKARPSTRKMQALLKAKKRWASGQLELEHPSFHDNDPNASGHASSNYEKNAKVNTCTLNSSELNAATERKLSLLSHTSL